MLNGVGEWNRTLVIIPKPDWGENLRQLLSKYGETPAFDLPFFRLENFRLRFTTRHHHPRRMTDSVNRESTYWSTGGAPLLMPGSQFGVRSPGAS